MPSFLRAAVPSVQELSRSLHPALPPGSKAQLFLQAPAPTPSLPSAEESEAFLRPRFPAGLAGHELGL